MGKASQQLWETTMKDCVLLDRKSVPDGEGGFYYEWKEGAPFKAAITFSTTVEARIAEKQGVKNLYTVTTNKNTVLNTGVYFKLLPVVQDGKKIEPEMNFRVTSDGKFNETPAGSTLNMRKVTAEEWRIE